MSQSKKASIKTKVRVPRDKTGSPTNKKVHFIGICGVAMSAVATALWQKDYKVTGSDSGFFPPVSTHLKNLGIPYYAGWHPEKMVEGGKPDFVIVGNATSTQNPEFLYVQKNKIPFKSYPEALGEFLIKKKSIVTTGTYGKTTSSALLTHILRHANLKPSYMIGGLTQDGLPSATIDTGEWSVVEGDEYTTAKWDQRPKFTHYKSTHLLLTAVKWDHADVYPTEESYFKAFETLIKSIPKNGMIVYCSDRTPLNKLVESYGSKIKNLITYGNNPEALYRYENVTQNQNGLVFDITYHGKTYHIKCPLLGEYNAENITGCFAMAHSIGIAPGDISDAIGSFKGMRRRLEKRYEHHVTVIDDIAHSPEKARSVLKTLRKIYKAKIVAIFEPNSGNRTPQSKADYKDAFKDADEVVIPKLTKLKADPKNPEKTFDGEELRDTIAESHKNTFYIGDDEKLLKHLVTERNDGDVIAFLGSHGFRGMIEEAVKRLAKH